jgi:signal transduction histidine kinase
MLKLEQEDSAMRFLVVDDGLGIPASEHRRVFEKFYRVDPNMTHGIGGTGLGLYICRELVQMMDGRIWVESKPGVGSTFVVEIPLALAPKVRGRPSQRAGARR